VKKIKIYTLIIFTTLLPIFFSGCGTVRGIGSDISVLGDIISGT